MVTVGPRPRAGQNTRLAGTRAEAFSQKPATTSAAELRRHTHFHGTTFTLVNNRAKPCQPALKDKPKGDRRVRSRATNLIKRTEDTVRERRHMVMSGHFAQEFADVAVHFHLTCV
ncbi:hypothetical protein GCM10009585_16090 [Brevibacterium paucivorans]